MTINVLRQPDDYRVNRVADPCSLVIFGATGDLSSKKLLPSVYDLANRGLLPPGFALVGLARTDLDRFGFIEHCRRTMSAHCRTPWSETVFQELSQGIHLVSGSFEDPQLYDQLDLKLKELESTRGTGGNCAFYLSIPPKVFAAVTQNLCRSKLADSGQGYWRRVIVEKPFGHDLASAKELNEVIESAFPADAVFRIDHYLGKETVQNIMVLRFMNRIFEPVWNRQHVDHVQITMAEDIGVSGRAGYYDGIGAARDVMQNHLFQLMAMVAMEEPASFKAEDIRKEKQKLLASVTLPANLEKNTARGQYASGWLGGEKVIGFLEEEGMDPRSRTETFAAVRLDIMNDRWRSVPFYLRTGKRLGRRVTEISLVLKSATYSDSLLQNAIVIRVQPDEGVSINFGSKVPGDRSEVRSVHMDFAYSHAFTQSSPEAYERLILDVLRGEPPLFPQQREVELSWEILDPIEEMWANDPRPLPQYLPGTWGPKCADDLLALTGRKWRRP